MRLQTQAAPRRRRLLLVVSFILVPVTGYLDYVTGYRMSFSIFYLVPVSAATWYVGRAAGVATACFSMIAWLLADVLAGHMGFDEPLVYWNAAMRLGFFLVVAFLGSSHRRVFERENRFARVDGLTEVANSRSFYEVAAAEIERSRRYRRPLSAAYVDLDGFKSVNDARGHAEGDEVLRAVAGTMKASVRAVDTVARLGGDEFILLLPETNSDQAREAITRVRERLDALAGAKEWPVTFSVGAVTFERPPASVDDLVRRADGLMYAVKNSGKNDLRHEVNGTDDGNAGRRITRA